MIGAVFIIATLSILYIAKRTNSFEEVKFATVVALVVAVLASGIILGGDAIGSEAHGPVHYQTHQMQAISVAQGGVQGSFFLASGSFGSHDQYYYYAEHSGGYKMYAVDYDEAIIKEDATPGTAAVDIPCQSSSMYGWVEWPLNFGTGIDWNCENRYGKNDYVFHVPPGSILYNVNLSLPKGQ